MSLVARDRPLRIIHLPVDIGGHASGLAQAQRQLGHDVQAVSLQWSELGFNADLSLDSPPGTPGRLLRREINRFSLLWRTLLAADVVHCHFGQTALSVRPFPLRDSSLQSQRTESLRLAYARLLWLKDLSLWRLLNKTLAMTFYGDDVRQIKSSIERNPHTHLALPEIAKELQGRDSLRARYLNSIDRNIPIIYAVNPDLLTILPDRAQWLGYSHCDPMTHPAQHWPIDARPLRLLHMPTNRAVKGTAELVAAVERLRKDGHQVTLTLVEGRHNAQALAELQSHHVLVDQLRVGWYGGVAVEAMLAGRPVVCYINDPDLSLVPKDLADGLPIIRAAPNTIEMALRNLLTLTDAQLQEKGVQARRFAERWHDPLQIAKIVLRDYQRAACVP